MIIVAIQSLKNSSNSVLNHWLPFSFISDLELLVEEENGVSVGAVQWKLMSYRGLEKVLDITQLLFTKVSTHILM